MWVKQCHKPAMTGNGKFIPPIKVVMPGDGLWHFFIHIIYIYMTLFVCYLYSNAIFSHLVYTYYISYIYMYTTS